MYTTRKQTIAAMQRAEHQGMYKNAQKAVIAYGKANKPLEKVFYSKEGSIPYREKQQTFVNNHQQNENFAKSHQADSVIPKLSNKPIVVPKTQKTESPSENEMENKFLNKFSNMPQNVKQMIVNIVDKESNKNSQEVEETHVEKKATGQETKQDQNDNQLTRYLKKETQGTSKTKQQGMTSPKPSPDAEAKKQADIKKTSQTQEAAQQVQPEQIPVPFVNITEIDKTVKRNITKIGQWISDYLYQEVCEIKHRDSQSDCCDGRGRKMHFKFDAAHMRNDQFAIEKFLNKVKGKTVTIFGDSMQRNFFMGVAEMFHLGMCSLWQNLICCKFYVK